MPKNMKYFLRLDSRGQIVATSGVYRKKMPLTGTWIEVESPECCSAFQLSYEPSDVTGTDFTVTILCDSSEFLTLLISGDETTDINDVVALLRKNAKFIGKWSTDGTNINLQIARSVASNCADAADLTFTVEPTVL